LWHSAKTPPSTSHRTLTHWSCSIKSWHKNPSFRIRNNVSLSRVSCVRNSSPNHPDSSIESEGLITK
jgi:hypothetical protein